MAQGFSLRRDRDETRSAQTSRTRIEFTVERRRSLHRRPPSIAGILLPCPDHRRRRRRDLVARPRVHESADLPRSLSRARRARHAWSRECEHARMPSRVIYARDEPGRRQPTGKHISSHRVEYTLKKKSRYLSNCLFPSILPVPRLKRTKKR